MERAWQFFVDPAGEPQENMARDEALAERGPGGPSSPAMRLYRWKRPAISLGRRQSAQELPAALARSGLPMVRRPTGGGAVVHRTDELTYAVWVPRERRPQGIRLSEIPGVLHASLRRVLVAQGWASETDLGFCGEGPAGPSALCSALCFSAPVSGDLLYGRQKVAGAAVRVRREGILVQGSLQGLPVEPGRLIWAFAALAAQGVWDAQPMGQGVS